MGNLFIAFLASYLAGAIPTAYIFGRMLKGIDIRKHGSGNVGATNALRVLGKGPGIVCLAIDIAKGALPVFVLGTYAAMPFPAAYREAVLIGMGICAICGHTWTVFLNFKGGKGIATTLGVLIGLACSIHGLLLAIGILLALWTCVFIATRIVSLASIIAALSFPFLMFLGKQSLLLCSASIVLALFVITRHKANIQRLLQGTEKKIKF